MNVWIIGCGKFGSRAAALLLRSRPDARITVVDPDPARIAPWRDRVEVVEEDGVAFMTRHLKTAPAPDWIIPAAPVHVACSWIMENALKVRLQTVPVPEEYFAALPNPFRGEDEAVYVSFADFQCPEDCPEPKDRCTVTGHPREEDMVTLFEKLQRTGFPSVVVHSRLLYPGVGGYRPDALWEMKGRIEKMDGPFLLGTACRCHGVLHALKASPVDRFG